MHTKISNFLDALMSAISNFVYTHAGVYLDYYNGDKVGDTIYDYEARVYFVCKAGTEIDGPVFEHLKDTNQAHFHVFTKYACK